MSPFVLSLLFLTSRHIWLSTPARHGTERSPPSSQTWIRPPKADGKTLFDDFSDGADSKISDANQLEKEFRKKARMEKVMTMTKIKSDANSSARSSRPRLHPEGMLQNSPTFQRLVRVHTRTQTSQGTIEHVMRWLMILVLASLCLSLYASDSAPLKLIQTVPLPGVRGRFDHFAIDTTGNRLFVAALGNNTLEVVDATAGKLIQSISGMSKPSGVLYLPEPNQILVANGDSGILKFLDAATYKVSQNLKDLPDADNLRFDSAIKLAWLGYGDGAMALVDPAAHKLLATVRLPAHPESFQLEKQGPRIFINVPDGKRVAVIDREKRSVTATWPMEKFQANFPMALDEPNQRLFIGCRKPASLVVLDTTTGNPVADLAISGDTDDLFYDAKRKRVYISCGEGFIDIVEQASADSYKRLGQVPTEAGARTSFFSPDLDRYFLAVPARGNQKAEIRVYQPE